MIVRPDRFVSFLCHLILMLFLGCSAVMASTTSGEPSEIAADDLMALAFGGSAWAEKTKEGVFSGASGGAPSPEPAPPAVDEATRRELEMRFASLSRSLGGLPQPPEMENKKIEVARMPFAEDATIGRFPGEPGAPEKKKRRRRFRD